MLYIFCFRQRLSVTATDIKEFPRICWSSCRYFGMLHDNYLVLKKTFWFYIFLFFITITFSQFYKVSRTFFYLFIQSKKIQYFHFFKINVNFSKTLSLALQFFPSLGLENSCVLNLADMVKARAIRMLTHGIWPCWQCKCEWMNSPDGREYLSLQITDFFHSAVEAV